jgi:hypothetical protein
MDLINAPNRLFFAMHKIFLVRFGAIWCDWVLLAAVSSRFKVQSSRFKVQSSRFKVQGPARNWKRAKIAGSGRHPGRSSLVGRMFSVE